MNDEHQEEFEVGGKFNKCKLEKCFLYEKT
jgi:hypothetical protein